MPTNKDTIVRHHLLELMFYIDENGNKITINNSVERLKDLGIYDDWKLCIEMTQSEHIRLHNANRSAETLAKMSVAQTGKTLSDETKAKLSVAMSKITGENHHMFGKTLSEETKKKISESLSGRTHSDKTKKKISENNVSHILTKEYKEYKKNGGELKWKQWIHERKLKLKEQWKKYREDGGVLDYYKWYKLNQTNND